MALIEETVIDANIFRFERKKAYKDTMNKNFHLCPRRYFRDLGSAVRFKVLAYLPCSPQAQLSAIDFARSREGHTSQRYIKVRNHILG